MSALDVQALDAGEQTIGAAANPPSSFPDTSNETLAASLDEGEALMAPLGGEGLLTYLHEGAPSLVSRITPDGDGSVPSETFMLPRDRSALRAWHRRSNGNSNCYFHVAIMRGQMRKRAKKADVAYATALWVDIDPRVIEGGATAHTTEENAAWLATEQERIYRLLTTKRPANVPPPTVIVRSGSGFQAYWKLRERFVIDGEETRWNEFETHTRWLEATLEGADHCHSCEHLMRLPGTWNIPDAKKRKRGRVRAFAEVVEFHPERVYDLTEFAQMSPRPNGVRLEAKAGKEPLPSATPKIFGSVKDIPWIQARRWSGLRDLILHAGGDADAPKEKLSQRARKIYGAWADEGITSDRSKVAIRIAMMLIEAGCDQATVTGVLLSPGFAVSSHCRDQSDPERAAKRTYEAAREWVLGSRVATITIDPGQLPQVLDACEQALLESGRDVYQRGPELVRAARLDEKMAAAKQDGVQRQVGTLIIVPSHAEWLAEQFERVVRFQKYDARAKAFLTTDCPAKLPRRYLARVGEWRVPVLHGTIEAPTLRAGDFSILEEPGYDEASGLYLDLGNVTFPKVPHEPTKKDAEGALTRILSPLRAFPFVPDSAADDWVPDGKTDGLVPSVSRSVVLSAILTASVRRSLRTAPLHAINACSAGTGKTLLSHVPSIIVTGREATIMGLGANEEETEKRLLAILREGFSTVVIDNVEWPIGGKAMCEVLTSPRWLSRILGESQSLEVPTSTLFIANGNNLRVREDMVRRTFRCDMDARCESPDKRQFDFDVLAEIYRQREQLLVDALTIIRAYVVAGRPLKGKVPHVGSFEDWTLIRETLVWLGQPDPAESRAHVEDTDPARDVLTEVMAAWAACIGTEPRRLRDVVPYLEDPTHAAEAKRLRLKNALLAATAESRLDARKIGHWFARVAGKIVSDRRFVRKADSSNGARIALLGACEQSKPCEKQRELRALEPSARVNEDGEQFF